MAERRTIFALASGAAKAGVAVVRVSGPEALASVAAMTRPAGRLPLPRTAAVRQLLHPRTRQPLDRAVVLTFPAPRSYTGEDVAELHVHGGAAVVSSVLQALGDIPGLRAAEPGEFTKRAFMNDKLDLTQVEALADLINAETEWQRRQALRQMEGGLTTLYERWRQKLIACLANVEAVLDFGESDEVEDGVLVQVHDMVDALLKELQQHLQQRHGEVIRRGVHATILGPPNAGKSSLLNVLAMRQAAIVSPIPGTTRDIIEVSVNMDGLPVVLSDTAGLRASTDLVEQEGIRRAQQRIEVSDVRICVLDMHDVIDEGAVPAAVQTLIDDDTVVVLNKSDSVALPRAQEQAVQQVKMQFPTRPVFVVSCTTSSGIAEFTSGLSKFVQQRLKMSDTNDHAPAITRQRHRGHLTGCVSALQAAQEQTDMVLAAEELRHALKCLGRITGRVDVEHILDAIFRDFCIGK